MEDSATTFWEQITEVLRARISAPDWCSWFADAQVDEVGPHGVTISLVNEFAVRWVRGRFFDALQSAVDQVAGIELPVALVSRETAAPRPHEHIEAAARATHAAPLGPAVISTRNTPAPAAQSAHTAPRGDNVMTDAELQAELGASTASAPAATMPPLPAVIGTSPGHYGNQPPSSAQQQAPVHDPELDADTLNPRYRFDSFVIGMGNQMAHAAALAVAESPAQAYNPLFVYGGTGLGKTHLLHAIGHYVRETRANARVAYVTTEQFVSRFIQTIQAMKTGSGTQKYAPRDRFKAWFRSVDVLLMDDVQFLAGKGTSLQEEIFHIFNALHERGGQVVLTSDCVPDAIPALEERLRSRFSWGLITDIASPDRETRIAILRKKAQSDQLQVPSLVFDLIAERVTTNVRELEGALTRVVAKASLTGAAITPQLASSILDAWAPQACEPVTISRIKSIVCEHFALRDEDLVSQRKERAVVRPRQIAMYLSRMLLDTPSTAVGLQFGGRDHTTVLHAAKRIEELVRTDIEVHDVVAELTERLRGSTANTGQPARSVHAGQ